VKLLAVGRLEPQKGFDLLVDALIEVSLDRPGGVFCTIVGDGSMKAALRAKADSAGLCSPSLRLQGWCPAELMPDVYADTDAVVISSRFETGPLVLGETWKVGRALITTKVGVAEEMCTDRVDALLVDIGDIGGIAKAIIELVDSKPLRDQLAAAGHARWGSLPTWADVAGRYVELYKRV
jgi:glycosyltransferase involved in cell wall biosynthesis